ncbi:MAG: hypothetical protein NT150_13480 [Bacteroidetes bacterium]|nr:hypothetical protein [Bacteroidota bacterium]
MNTIYTSEQLKKELSELQKKRDSFRNDRVSALKKFQKKSEASENNTGIDLHNIERKIEALERKLDSLL